MPRLLLVLMIVAGLAVACTAGASDDPAPGVVVEVVSPAPGPSEVPVGGKPEPSVVVVAPTAVPPAATVAPAPTPPPTTASGAVAPSSGRWIDVDVTNYRVRLMDGTQTMRTLAPVAVGAQVDTGAYESTQTGLFHVYNKIAGLQWDAPYKTYISDWVGFDPDKANGFHSFLEDEKGQVVNGATGRVSNGCIRTGDAPAVYAFAEIGMPVFVHF